MLAMIVVYSTQCADRMQPADVCGLAGDDFHGRLVPLVGSGGEQIVQIGSGL